MIIKKVHVFCVAMIMCVMSGPLFAQPADRNFIKSGSGFAINWPRFTTVNSEDQLVKLIRNYKNVKYDAEKKELTLKDDFFVKALCASLVGATGAFMSFVGIKEIQDANCYIAHGLDAEDIKRFGIGLLGLSGLFYALAGFIFMNDHEIKLSPEGIKLAGKDRVKWLDVKAVLGCEIFLFALDRPQGILQVDRLIKAGGLLEQYEELFTLKEACSLIEKSYRGV